MKPQIGSMLATLAAQGARTGKVDAAQARMCSGCAFRKGTLANQEQEAAENALEALLTDRVQFNCHQERERTCVGYRLASVADQ